MYLNVSKCFKYIQLFLNESKSHQMYPIVSKCINPLTKTELGTIDLLNDSSSFGNSFSDIIFLY